MIAALLLAGFCAYPPLFDLSGPVCTNPGECQCSECLSWLPTTGAERYDVLRHNPGGSTTKVGSSRVLAAYVGDDGVAHAAVPQTFYCFALDNPFPVEGTVYSYEVRAVSSAWTPNEGPWCGLTGATTYTAAPYWCWRNGVRVVCQ